MYNQRPQNTNFHNHMYIRMIPDDKMAGGSQGSRSSSSWQHYYVHYQYNPQNKYRSLPGNTSALNSVNINTTTCQLCGTTCLFKTHLPLGKIAAISQTIFSDAFSWIKNFVFWLKFLWRWFLMMVQLTKTGVVWIMAWRRIGDMPLSEPMLTRFTDAYMRH